MSRPMRVLVTGGTGKTGARVASLLAGLPDVVPTVASRGTGPADTDTGTAIGTASGADAVRFDWHDPASTTRALDETHPDAVYLVAPPRDPEPVLAMQPFLDEARDRGVRRAVLLGAKPVAAGDGGLGAVYDAVATAFDEWAILRPTWFMQDFVTDHHLATMVRDGVLRTASPAGGNAGRIAYIDAEDIAAVAVTALTASDVLRGELLLTGPEALTPDEVASTIGRELRRTIRVERVSEPELAAHFAERMPPALAAALAHADATYSDARPTDTVERVTGRSPRTLASFAHDERGAFTG